MGIELSRSEWLSSHVELYRFAVSLQPLLLLNSNGSGVVLELHQVGVVESRGFDESHGFGETDLLICSLSTRILSLRRCF